MNYEKHPNNHTFEPQKKKPSSSCLYTSIYKTLRSEQQILYNQATSSKK